MNRLIPVSEAVAAQETVVALGAVDTAPGCARAILGGSLATWGLLRLRDDGEAIISELVANAVAASIEYARAGAAPCPVAVRITVRDGELCLRVWDPDPAPPPRDLPPPGDEAERGRGLLIVGALARRWGWHPGPGGGKHVWAALALGPGGPCPGDAA